MSGFSLISFFFLLYQEIVQTQFGSRIGGGNNTDDSDDDQGDIELSFGNKDTFVLEVRLQLFFFNYYFHCLQLYAAKIHLGSRIYWLHLCAMMWNTFATTLLYLCLHFDCCAIQTCSPFFNLVQPKPLSTFFLFSCNPFLTTFFDSHAT